MRTNVDTKKWNSFFEEEEKKRKRANLEKLELSHRLLDMKESIKYENSYTVKKTPFLKLLIKKLKRRFFYLAYKFSNFFKLN